MRVALIVHQFPSIEHPYITEWARELVRAGIDLTILVEKTPSRLAADLPEQDSLLHRVRRLNSLDFFQVSLRSNAEASLKNLTHIPKAYAVLRSANPGKPLTVLRKLFEYLPVLSERFDLIHFNTPQIAIRRFEMGSLLGGKTLVSFRGQDISFHPTRYDRLLKDADHLHFISMHLLKLAISRGFDGSKYTIIPPMVETCFYYPMPDANPGTHLPYVLFTAARIEWVKGFEFALQAVALLRQRGIPVEYYIAGDGELRDAIIYTIHQLGIQEHVHLLGWQTPTEIREWMWKSDLYVLASVSEAFNNSVLHAQACGLPVVCSDAGGLPENIQNGVTGLLAKRRDHWSLAEKIYVLLKGESRRAKMRINARRRVELEFCLSSNIGKFVAMYDSIIQ